MKKTIFDYRAFSKEMHIKIATIDEYRGRSLSSLGREWGLSKATMSRAANGIRCELETVLTICFFLDMDINNYSNI